jgi:hypothetical protein
MCSKFRSFVGYFRTKPAKMCEQASLMNFLVKILSEHSKPLFARRKIMFLRIFQSFKSETKFSEQIANPQKKKY